MFIILLLMLSLASSINGNVKVLDPFSDEFIDYINSVQDSWVAGRNLPPDTSISFIGNGTIISGRHRSLPRKIHDPELIASLPDSFDARQKWPHCPSLNAIRDQGQCGSCWVFGSVEAMTDRICIHSEGKVKKHLSAEEAMCCAKATSGNGCSGKDIVDAYDYWKQDGIVTGGDYNTHEGCQPYTIPSMPEILNYHRNENKLCTLRDVIAPPCSHKCISGYKVPFDKDKSFGENIYTLKGEDDMKAEIYKYGPITAAIDFYNDLQMYQGGVYSHTPGLEQDGAHAIKILGWGEEKGKKYWLLANSWGFSWGPYHGFFKMLRGTDECNIESYEIVAGLPKL